MPKLKTILVILTLILLSFPIYKPLFDPGFFPVHDDMQAARVFEMANALRDRQFPVRILKNFGYGYHYPLFNFYSPLPYYVGAFFNLTGFSVLISTKIMFFIPNLLSIIFMYILMKKLTKSDAISFVSTILYIYFPYRAADNYVRGVAGEIYVMMFLPLLVLGVYEILHAEMHLRPHLNFLFVSSLAGIILSHNIYAYIVCLGLAIFSIAYLATGITKKDKSYLSHMSHLITNSLFSLGLTAFFWLPAFAEGSFTHLDKINQAGYYFGNYFINLRDLWQSDWGYGGAAGGMTFMIGKTQVILGVAAFFLVIYRILKNKRINILSLFFLFLTVTSVFMTNKSSFLIWNDLPLMSLTQYPMRFIFFIDFFLILFIALTFSKINLPKIFSITLICLISLIVIFKTAGIFRSKFNYDFTEKYLSESYIRWETSRMADEYLPKQFDIPIDKNEISDNVIKTNGQAETEILEHKSDELIARIKTSEKIDIAFPVTYFPGWKMFVNGTEKSVKTTTKYYLITGNFDKGDFIVKLNFENTPVRTLGNILSLVFLSLIMTHIIVKNKSYGRNP